MSIPKSLKVRAGALVTQESVVAVAEKLEENGQTVSVRKVIEALGGGSPNTVLPLVQAWKQARPMVKPADVVIDPRLVQVLAEQISMEVARARRDALEESEAIRDDAATTAEAGRKAEARVEELTEDLEQARNEQQQQAGRIAVMVEEMEALKASTSKDVSEAKADALREREAAEAARQALARAELRLEALPVLEKELSAAHGAHEKEVATLRAALEVERAARSEAEKLAAVADAKKTAEHERAESAESARKQAQADLRDTAQHSRVELAELRKQLQEKSAEVEQLLREHGGQFSKPAAKTGTQKDKP